MAAMTTIMVTEVVIVDDTGGGADNYNGGCNISYAGGD